MRSFHDSITRATADYAARAAEYDRATGYGAERVEGGDAQLKELYQIAFRDRDVLEIACGTGYWTEAISKTAHSVLATDVHPKFIEATRQRLKSFANVRCLVTDAFSLKTVSERFSAAFAQYWWSHIPRDLRKPFLDILHTRLVPGALVLFTDYVGYQSSLVKRRVDEHGDVYEEQTLPDGSRIEAIKNSVSRFELQDLLADIAEDVAYLEHDTGDGARESSRLWTMCYRVREFGSLSA